LSDYQSHSIDLSRLQSDDSLPILGTTADLIDLDKVTRHLERARDNERFHGPLNPMEYLLRRRCLIATDSGMQATIAGILCFGRDPQAIFPRAVVDLGHYLGVEPISTEVIHLEKDIGGTIFDQIDRIETYLWANTHHGMRLSETSSERQDVHQYPRPVIRELVVNMLGHRDYQNFRSAARVHLFRNCIEWISPGGLPPGVTVENILYAQSSRNPAILSVLYDAKLVEEFGQGLDTVVAILRREGLQPPKFEDVGTFFVATVAGRPAEALYSGAYAQLTERQRRILAFIRMQGETTPRDLATLFDQQVTIRSLQRDLRELLEANMIIDEGKGRAVRYRLSEVIL
jgi:predicted HTH transcriptional regulator